MQTEVKPDQAVDDHAVALALDLSVHTVRKDRQKLQRIPFYKINGSVRYNLARVFEAMAAYEHGGPRPTQARRSRGGA
jgi:hypothetical protein